MENSVRDGNTRPPDLPLEKPIRRSESNKTGRGTTDWFQIGKGVRQGCILSSCLFNLYAKYIMWNVRLDEAQDGIKIFGRNISQMSLICRWHRPYGRKWRRTKGPLDESERGEWKTWLKTQHSETKIMSSSPITSWQIDGKTMETVTNFLFLDSRITADGDCRHEIKRQSLKEKLWPT